LVERRLGIKASVNVDESIGLTPQAEQELFRIVTEALNNALKYARASQVHVTLQSEKDQAVLEVQDNGSGFDPTGAFAGMGLQNMRERTYALGGHMVISSQPGSGTRIRVEIPQLNILAGEGHMEIKIRVLVVDDHTVIRKGLCLLLSAEKYGIEVVGEAADGRDAIEKSRSLNPDVILLDLVMPGMGGLEAIPAIRQGNPEARILILTSFAEDDQILEAIRSGALGYLIKDASPDELVSTIHNVYLNRMSLPPELGRKMMLGSQIPGVNQPTSLLTDREVDVLRCVAQGYSNKQIASELSISTNTVRTHVSNLLQKLNLENRTQLALYTRQNKTLLSAN